jgi:hypothetical protein
MKTDFRHALTPNILGIHSEFEDRAMITGIHAVLFSDRPDVLREFFADKLGLEHAEAFRGWPIFTTPTSELGCHEGGAHGAPPSGTHQISFYCDDLSATVSELKERGVSFSGEVEKRLYGSVIRMSLPDGTEAELYQPSYKGPWVDARLPKAQ